MLSVVDVTKKWAHMRTQYFKELTLLKQKLPSGSGSSSGQSKWRFFTAMQFVQPAATNKAARKSNLTVCQIHCTYID